MSKSGYTGWYALGHRPSEDLYRLANKPMKSSQASDCLNLVLGHLNIRDEAGTKAYQAMFVRYVEVGQEGVD